MAYIPGYLLKKVYVKGSMRLSQEGLEFRLRNDLASAQLTGLSVEVDGRPVEAYIEIGGEKRPTSSISPASPILFPRGSEAKITAIGSFAPGKHRVAVRARVAGFGEGKLEIEDEAR